MSCLKPNEFGNQKTDLVIQIFVLFHLRPMWLFYRKYWSGHFGNEKFEIEYEHVFTEKQISLLYGSIPSDCMFAHSHPVEPLLLDYFFVELRKDNTQWKSRFIRILETDSIEKQVPQVENNELNEDTSSSSERSCEEYED